MRTESALRSLIVCVLALLAGCARMTPAPLAPSGGHLDRGDTVKADADIPDVVAQSGYVPPPQALPATERYTVVVNDVPVRELLFALARDADMNVDISGQPTGNITLNAIEQTLPQILDRVARQANLRYRMEGETILVEPDAPFFRTYEVGYVNLSRDTDTVVSVATQVATTGEGGNQESRGQNRQNNTGSGSQGTNSSSTRVNSRSTNRFWETLAANILGILGEPAQGDAATANLVVNAEAGIVSVNATSRQHEEIGKFIDRVLTNARRQVLIEATIVEVTLNDQYQGGVDWKLLTRTDKAGFSFNQALLGAVTDGVIDNAVSAFTLGYRDPDASGQLVEATLRLLREFGDTKVLSSPRLMVINNQTALLKVVEELVYFTIDVMTTDATLNAQGRSFVESQVHSVPVGLVMAVTPQISANQEVTLTVRPTISQKIGDAIDPGPQVASQLNRQAGQEADTITNTVPVIRTREMESVLKLINGEVGVLGGLMQDEAATGRREVPGLASIPFIGETFFDTDEMRSRKTELVIFLRPVIVNDPNVDTDLGAYEQFLGQDGDAPR